MANTINAHQVRIIHVRKVDGDGNETAVGHLAPMNPSRPDLGWMFCSYGVLPWQAVRYRNAFTSRAEAMQRFREISGIRLRAEYPAPSSNGWQCDQCDLEYPGSVSSYDLNEGRELACGACIVEHADRCDHCYGFFTSDNLAAESADGGSSLCQHCYDDHYFTCDECQNVLTLYDCAVDSLCVSCAVRCDDCDEYHRRDSMQSDQYRDICDTCYYNRWFYCEGCDYLVHSYNYGQDDRCVDCVPDTDIPYEYQYPGAVRFFGDPRKGQRTYGIEIEIEVDPDCFHDGMDEVMSRANRASNEAYLQEEVSIRLPGFEYTTHAMTFDYMRDHLTRVFKDPIPGLYSWDTSGRCGIHIHVSRKPLGELTVGKILAFITNPSHKHFIVELAGRESERFASLNEKSLTCAKYGSKMDAVNTSRSETIEFRIFRGTLKLESILRNVEFVDAVCAFTKDSSLENLTLLEFLAYVARTPKRWPSLVAWLWRKHYLEDTRKPQRSCLASTGVTVA